MGVFFQNIFCLDLLCAIVRLALAMLAAYSSFHVLFYRIESHDDLVKYFQEIELPEDESAIKFKKFRKIFMWRWIFTTGLAATALLAIQYPENSTISNATAVLYGLLGPWAIRDKIAFLLRQKARTSLRQDIVTLKPDVKETVNSYLTEVFGDFEKVLSPLSPEEIEGSEGEDNE